MILHLLKTESAFLESVSQDASENAYSRVLARLLLGASQPLSVSEVQELLSQEALGGQFDENFLVQGDMIEFARQEGLPLNLVLVVYALAVAHDGALSLGLSSEQYGFIVSKTVPLAGISFPREEKLDNPNASSDFKINYAHLKLLSNRGNQMTLFHEFMHNALIRTGIGMPEAKEEKISGDGRRSEVNAYNSFSHALHELVSDLMAYSKAADIESALQEWDKSFEYEEQSEEHGSGTDLLEGHRLARRVLKEFRGVHGNRLPWPQITRLIFDELRGMASDLGLVPSENFMNDADDRRIFQFLKDLDGGEFVTATDEKAAREQILHSLLERSLEKAARAELRSGEPRRQRIADTLTSILQNGLLSPRAAARQGIVTTRGADAVTEQQKDIEPGMALAVVQEFSGRGDGFSNSVNRLLRGSGLERSPAAILGERKIPDFDAELAGTGTERMNERLESGAIILMSSAKTPQELKKEAQEVDWPQGAMSLGFEEYAPSMIEAIFLPGNIYAAVAESVPESLRGKLIPVEGFTSFTNLYAGEAYAQLVTPDWREALSSFLQERLQREPGPRTFLVHGTRFPTLEESEAARSELRAEGDRPAEVRTPAQDLISRSGAILAKLQNRGMPALEQNILRSAMVLAQEAHKNQTRKSGLPYSKHFADVAEILIDRFDVTDLEALVIAVFHDLREDQRGKYEEVLKTFSATPGAAQSLDMKRIRRGILFLSVPDEGDASLYGDVLEFPSQTYLEQLVDPLSDPRAAAENLNDVNLDEAGFLRRLYQIKLSDVLANVEDSDDVLLNPVQGLEVTDELRSFPRRFLNNVVTRFVPGFVERAVPEEDKDVFYASLNKKFLELTQHENSEDSLLRQLAEQISQIRSLIPGAALAKADDGSSETYQMVLKAREAVNAGQPENLQALIDSARQQGRENLAINLEAQMERTQLRAEEKRQKEAAKNADKYYRETISPAIRAFKERTGTLNPSELNAGIDEIIQLTQTLLGDYWWTAIPQLEEELNELWKTTLTAIRDRMLADPARYKPEPAKNLKPGDIVFSGDKVAIVSRLNEAREEEGFIYPAGVSVQDGAQSSSFRGFDSFSGWQKVVSVQDPGTAARPELRADAVDAPARLRELEGEAFETQWHKAQAMREVLSPLGLRAILETQAAFSRARGGQGFVGLAPKILSESLEIAAYFQILEAVESGPRPGVIPTEAEIRRAIHSSPVFQDYDNSFFAKIGGVGERILENLLTARVQAGALDLQNLDAFLILLGKRLPFSNFAEDPLVPVLRYVPRNIGEGEDWMKDILWEEPAVLREAEIGLEALSFPLREKVEVIQGSLIQQRFPYSVFLMGSTVSGKEGADLDLFASPILHDKNPSEVAALRRSVKETFKARFGYPDEKLKDVLMDWGWNYLALKETAARYGRAFRISAGKIFSITLNPERQTDSAADPLYQRIAGIGKNLPLKAFGKSVGAFWVERNVNRLYRELQRAGDGETIDVLGYRTDGGKNYPAARVRNNAEIIREILLSRVYDLEITEAAGFKEDSFSFRTKTEPNFQAVDEKVKGEPPSPGRRAELRTEGATPVADLLTSARAAVRNGDLQAFAAILEALKRGRSGVQLENMQANFIAHAAQNARNFQRGASLKILAQIQGIQAETPSDYVRNFDAVLDKFRAQFENLGIPFGINSDTERDIDKAWRSGLGQVVNNRLADGFIALTTVESLDSLTVGQSLLFNAKSPNQYYVLEKIDRKDLGGGLVLDVLSLRSSVRSKDPVLGLSNLQSEGYQLVVSAPDVRPELRADDARDVGEEPLGDARAIIAADQDTFSVFLAGVDIAALTRDQAEDLAETARRLEQAAESGREKAETVIGDFLEETTADLRELTAAATLDDLFERVNETVYAARIRRLALASGFDTVAAEVLIEETALPFVQLIQNIILSRITGASRAQSFTASAEIPDLTPEARWLIAQNERSFIALANTAFQELKNSGNEAARARYASWEGQSLFDPEQMRSGEGWFIAASVLLGAAAGEDDPTVIRALEKTLGEEGIPFNLGFTPGSSEEKFALKLAKLFAQAAAVGTRFGNKIEPDKLAANIRLTEQIFYYLDTDDRVEKSRRQSSVDSRGVHIGGDVISDQTLSLVEKLKLNAARLKSPVLMSRLRKPMDDSQFDLVDSEIMTSLVQFFNDLAQTQAVQKAVKASA